MPGLGRTYRVPFGVPVAIALQRAALKRDRFIVVHPVGLWQGSPELLVPDPAPPGRQAGPRRRPVVPRQVGAPAGPVGLPRPAGTANPETVTGETSAPVLPRCCPGAG